MEVGADEVTVRVEGDADAFFRAHHREAVRWAVALLGRRDAAEDVAQEALWQTMRRLDDLDSPVAFLRRCVINGCHSWHRARARDGRRERLVAPAEKSSELSPSTAEVVDLLGQMPYRQRAVVVLRYWADWTDVDIAAALDTTPGNVRVLAHRGLDHLRRSLSEGTMRGGGA